jgi:hypothetical protein
MVVAGSSRPALPQAVTAAQVPAAVKQALQAKFPGAGTVEWKIKSDKNYEAEFSRKGVDVAVKFDSTAKWLETETTVPRSTIPSAVRDTVAKKFKGYNVIETQTLQRWNEKRVFYELHLDNAKEVVKAQFDAGGAILTRSAKPKP